MGWRLSKATLFVAPPSPAVLDLTVDPETLRMVKRFLARCREEHP